MKKYLLFAGSRYYPDGGFKDFQATSNHIQDLLKFYIVRNEKALIDDNLVYFQWGHIVDSSTLKIIKTL